MTRNAAVDYAPSGIRVNSVNMAATDTPMIQRAGEGRVERLYAGTELSAQPTPRPDPVVLPPLPSLQRSIA